MFLYHIYCEKIVNNGNAKTLTNIGILCSFTKAETQRPKEIIHPIKVSLKVDFF